MEAGVSVYSPGEVEIHDSDPDEGEYDPSGHGISSEEPLFDT